MKILIVPDVHLKYTMFEDAKKILREHPEIEKAVVLGDYFDDWDCERNKEKYERTIDSALSLLEEFPQTIFLWGNHDVAYMTTGLNCSGHSFWLEREAWQLLRELEKKTEIKFVVKIDDVLFSHGGISEMYASKFEYKDLDDLVNQINGEYFRDVWYSDGSPLWFRPNDLYPAIDCWQVVGHTPFKCVKWREKMLMTDVFSTYSNGDDIGECRFPVFDTLTHDYYLIGG